VLCPIHFQYHAEKVAPGEWIIVFDATIDEHWHLYSQKTYPVDAIAPFPTVISVDSSDTKNVKGLSFVGIAEEVGAKIVKKEPLFDNATIEWYEGKATLKQKVKVANTTDTLHGLLEYMTCDD
jgi:thiol:disulfide interchange protein DsbD